MSYTDNPQRPRTHFWFGPMTMVDFMGTYNLNRLYVAGRLPRSPDLRVQAGPPGGPHGRPEQPPERLHVADHVQRAADLVVGHGRPVQHRPHAAGNELFADAKRPCGSP